MRLGGVVFTYILILSCIAFSASASFAEYQLSEVTAAWDGTDADRLKAPSGDYDYTYGDETSFVYQLPWAFYFNGSPCYQITVDTNGRMWIGSSPVAAWNSDLSSYYYGGVFVHHKTDPERVVIEWQTETYEEESFNLPNRFEIVLYRNGTIRFDYNSFMTTAGTDSGSGLTAGSTTYSITSTYGNIYTLAGRSFQFSGTPIITVDPGNFEITFPDTYLGQETAPQVYTITNIGGGNLIIGQIYLNLPPSIPTPQFRIISDFCSGRTLDPLASCEVRVVYNPTLTYGGVGYLKIPSNDSAKPLFQSFLQGGNILTTIPTVTITSPASGATNSRTPLLAYAVSDGSAVTVTIDGTSVAKSSGQTIDNLPDGPHTVIVQSVTPGAVPAVVNFIVDTVLPVVTIYSPHEGLTNDNTPLINYFVSDGSVAVKVDGTAVGKTSGQRLDPLTDGTHDIQIISTDAAGNSASAGVTITVDATTPVLSMSTLADQSTTRNRTLNVSGTVTDASPVQLTVNDQPVSVANSAFSTAILLARGANTIRTAATDLAGNVTTDSRTVMYDGTGPVITLASPADGTYTKSTSVLVNGTVDQQDATVTVSGIAASREGINFTATVDLFEGLNTIEVVATDLYGNTSKQKRTITFDSIKPQVAITVPPQDIATSQPQIPISGTVSDADPVTVSSLFNGISIPLTITNGTFGFSVDFSNLPQGTYPVTITAIDAAGNSTIATRTIIYDTTAPALTIDPTPEQASIPKLLLSGTVDDNATVTVTNPATNTGEMAAIDNGTWSHTVTLLPGVNTITVEAKDPAGNAATRTVTITLGSTASLAVTFSGTGSGTVTSSPAGIACNTNCSADFPAGTPIVLSPAASEYSIFNGWTDGGCSGSGSCSFTLNGNLSITASFDKDTTHGVLIGGSFYASIQTAYGAASDNSVIRLWGITYTESLNLNRPITVTLQGGYDAGYSQITGTTSIDGTVTVTDGLVIADRITIF